MGRFLTACGFEIREMRGEQGGPQTTRVRVCGREARGAAYGSEVRQLKKLPGVPNLLLI